jgi:hypothetical protein
VLSYSFLFADQEKENDGAGVNKGVNSFRIQTPCHGERIVHLFRRAIGEAKEPRVRCRKAVSRDMAYVLSRADPRSLEALFRTLKLHD